MDQTVILHVNVPIKLAAIHDTVAVTVYLGGKEFTVICLALTGRWQLIAKTKEGQL